MIKQVLAATAALAASSGAAFAGPYVNLEANSAFTGSNYSSTTTDLHLGYAGATESGISYYVQAGPSYVQADAVEDETEFSGKAGASLSASENIDVYGEVSFLTGEDDTNYGGKLGVTYSF